MKYFTYPSTYVVLARTLTSHALAVSITNSNVLFHLALVLVPQRESFQIATRHYNYFLQSYN